MYPYKKLYIIKAELHSVGYKQMMDYLEDIIKLAKVTFEHLKEELGAALLAVFIYFGKKMLTQTKNKFQVLIDVKDFTEINNLLLRLNEKTSSDRCFLVSFKNDFNNPSQSQEIKYDVKSEVCASGIRSSIDDRQDLSVNKYTGLLDNFLNNESYIVNDINTLVGEAWAELDLMGIKSFCFTPIKNKQKIEYALGVDYVTSIHNFSKEDISNIEKTIQKIKLILF